MNAKVMVRIAALALGLAATAAMAAAQEPPAPEPVDDAVREDHAADDFDNVGGLDLLLAADVAPGPGGGGRMGPGPRGGPGIGRRGPAAAELREKLNLTDDQKSRLADIRDRHERAAVPIQGDLRIASLDLRKLMRADRPDQRAIDAQIDRIASLRASLQKSRIAGQLEARAVLTPAQQRLMREHRGGPMGHRMREGRGRPGGRGMWMRRL
ncbi:MAG: Spy/CpxP family protein refolding chaperone [Candidatus Eiseniibacteriota bacterium]